AGAAGVARHEPWRVTPRTLVMLVVLTLIWGTNWPLFPLAVREVSVWTFRSVSGLAAALVLLAVARRRGLALALPRSAWLPVGLAALFYMVVWNVAATYAANLIPSGQAAILGFTMPLWSVLISWAVLGEPLSRRVMAAVVLGAAAVTLLMVPSFASFAQAPLGLALGLLSGLGWAIGTLVLKRSDLGVPTLVLTGWQLLLSTIPMVLGSLVLGDWQWFVPSWTTIAVIAYIALVPTSLGNLCWFSIVASLPANVAGLASIMVPMVAMLSGAIVHGEPLGALQWLAMLCSASALSLVLLRPSQAG
ncbi:MAG: DMT family transporter, partial [Burkholderiaceae bacterium]